jgi:para-aminobenzoate synthetase component 1
LQQAGDRFPDNFRPMVRRPIVRKGTPCWDPAVLDRYGTLLFRRVLDRGRSVLALGVHTELDVPHFDHDGTVPDWTFGHMCYDRKNTLERLTSRHPDPQGYPVERWFVPRTVVEWDDERTILHLHPDHAEEGEVLAEALFHSPVHERKNVAVTWTGDTDRATYLNNAGKLLDHIRRGDIYEVNYCVQHSAKVSDWDPYHAFDKLLRRTQAPFAAFYRHDARFVLCASPERFLAFADDRVVGEPMKGTRPRSSEPAEDARLAQELASDAKERSENVMALDVMRNDLSRVSASRSVVVPELCQVRSYPSVHQMVSTVQAVIAPGRTPYDVLLAAFPMASMTGAPKIRAMQLIDEAEDQRRSLFSGTLGFFAPDGTGDFNVVIRSIFHDRDQGTLKVLAGSALTAHCDPEAEWEECALKARTVMEAIA